MKSGTVVATLGLVVQGNAFVTSFNARQTFVGPAVTHATATPSSTRHTRQVLKAVAAAPAVETEVLTKVRFFHHDCWCCTGMPSFAFFAALEVYTRLGFPSCAGPGTKVIRYHAFL